MTKVMSGMEELQVNTAAHAKGLSNLPASEAAPVNGMKHLSAKDLMLWLNAITCQPKSSSDLISWLEGPLKAFFSYKGLALAHGELTAGQLKITHFLSTGLEDRYLQQIATTFELESRGSLKWWFLNRQPFYIDPQTPPFHTSDFELKEIEEFGLINVAAHGVLNVRASAGTYFGFSGVQQPLGEWHLEALTLMAPVLNDLLLSHLAALQQPPAVSAQLDGLAPRQKAVLRLLVAGMDDKGIGATLGISQKTVRNHLAEVYAILGVHKRAQLIALLK